MKKVLKGFTEGLVWFFIFKINKDMIGRVSWLFVFPFIHILNLHRHQQNENLSPEILQKCQCAFLPGLC